MQKTQMIKGYIFVILSGLIFGFMPLMSKFIYAENVNPMTLVFLRSALALPVLALGAVWSGASLRIPPKSLPSVAWLSVVGYCLTPVLLLSSYQFIPSGTATVFHFIYPAVVVLAEFLIFKTNPGKKGVLSLVACSAGIALFYTPGVSLNPVGSVVALVSGVTYAAYIVALSQFKHKEISPFTLSFHVSVVCAVIMFLVCVMTNQLMLPQSFKGWGLAILFAVSLNVGAVVLFQQGTFIIGGARASILSTFEPITSVVAGALVFGEKIGLPVAVGTALVLTASVLIAAPAKNSRN